MSPTVNGWDAALIATLLEALDGAETLNGESELLRKFPYPYKAMACITSDCDATTAETFMTMHRFLNTFEDTPYGPGLGLDIADSFFAYNGSDYPGAADMLTWFEGTDPGAAREAAFIQKYWECGWIDSIHALGDFSNTRRTLFTRELALSAWEALEAAGIRPSVWIDHGTATNVQNFAAYHPNNASSYQRGDDPESPYYHTDVTLDRIRFAWYSRNSSSFGFNFPLEPRTLRDGASVWVFHRYTHDSGPGGALDWTWRPSRLHDQITEKRLDALEEQGQYAILAQHITTSQPEFQPADADIEALRLLADRFHQTRTILVARTSRLLAYAVARKYLVFQVASAGRHHAVRILGIDDPVTGFREPYPDELRGLTFYIGDPGANVVIFVGDEPLSPEETQHNAMDERRPRCTSIPWFDQDTFDYTAVP